MADSYKAKDFEEVETGGDMLLVCGEGDDQRKIRVASAVLIRSSTVFKAMLSPRFKEGTQLATEHTVEVSLPEDGADDMSIICRSLHLQNDKVPIERLCQLAKITDKYDLGVAMRPMAHSWILSLRNKPNKCLATNLLAAADYFQCGDLFEGIAHDIILESPRGMPKPNSLWALEVPENLARAFVEMDRQKNEVRHQMAAAIDAVIEREYDVRPDCGYRCMATCSYAEKRLHLVIGRFAAARIWPRAVLDRQALEHTLRAMENLRFRPEDLVEIEAENVCGTKKGSCAKDLAHPIDSPYGEMLAKSRKASEAVKGICYRCVRGGNALAVGCSHPKN